mmetsp:Transcript_19119/g.33998  ORF Transcript_19119/g.33998 Transcript_19119/m.33998 type:complete len:90 (-) Transcript_19119:284-553(-)
MESLSHGLKHFGRVGNRNIRPSARRTTGLYCWGGRFQYRPLVSWAQELQKLTPTSLGDALRCKMLQQQLQGCPKRWCGGGCQLTGAGPL